MNPTLLFIEPDSFFRQIYETHFRAEGFDVVCAAHGERVLDLMKQIRPQVIVMALALPRKDGFEVLEELQTLSESERAPVVILSRIGSRDVMERCFQVGVCAYFIKQHHQPEEVVARVRGYV